MLRRYATGEDPQFLALKIGQMYPHLEVRVDNELAFHRELIPMLLNGRELVSVRFSLGKVRVPGGEFGVMPLVETDPDNLAYRHQIGTVSVPLFYVATVRDFPVPLAMMDTYRSKTEMLDDLEGIYGIRPLSNDILSAYVIGELSINRKSS